MIRETDFLSLKSRKAVLKEVSANEYDLAIIGGGVTGAGIALDAASRGLKVVLLEKNDFASGTSSKSTKLIHGGLRYLKQLEIGLVRNTGTERAVLHRLAPHMVKPEKMLLPLIKNGTYGKMSASFGLWVYDLVAGVTGDDRRKMLGPKATKETEPMLDEENLLGSGVYAEYRTDDARLTIELIKTATRYGATCLNYFHVEDFLNENSQVVGVTGKDLYEEKKVAIKAKFVVSAAGPWVDTIRKKNNSINDKTLRLTKGTHIVVDKSDFPLKQSVYFDVPDGRMIFAIPRGKVTYIGTTDTDYKEDIDKVEATSADAHYLVDSVNATFPSLNLSVKDIKSSWSGLRPLIHQQGKSPSEISRKDEVFQAEDGLISIAGGKLTGYRTMAKKIVDLVISKYDETKKFKKCETKSIPLLERPLSGVAEVNQYTLQIAERLKKGGIEDSDYYADYLVSNYGTSADQIVSKGVLAMTESSLIIKELEYSVDNEMVASSCDFFIRRTGRLYFDIDSVIQFKEAVNKDLCRQLDWSESKKAADMADLEAAIKSALSFRVEEQENEFSI
ncbi:MAG: glycerol-3-phosphate dehydrogenase/oxidase [Cyclobacteriaceae bacterium]